MSKRTAPSCQFAEVTVYLTASSCRNSLLILVICFLLPALVLGQLPQAISGSLTVYVQGADGAPVGELAVAVLTSMTGQYHQQATTRGGTANFTGLEGGSYNLSVVAVGYQPATEQLQLTGGEANIVTLRLQPASEGHPSVSASAAPILSPRAKKELGKALEAMRSGKLTEAHNHLLVAYRLAPGNPEVNFVFGLYCAQTNDWTNAKSYWEKVLNLYSKHVGALLSMGTVLLRENKPADAETYFKRAVDVEPSSWRAHGLLADACLRQGLVDESVAEAQHAVELGHGQAAVVEPLLALALAKRGDTKRAIQVLLGYLRENPLDANARKQLEDLQTLSQGHVVGDAEGATLDSALPMAPALAGLSLLPPSTWLPPDVDERVPPVEPGTACDLKEVLQSAEKRVEEFVRDVDRFTATESIIHQSINKWGLASPPETFKFDYLVSIEQAGPGLLDVEEYRPRAYSSARFPDGVERTGLAALMLIFHPYNAGNFEMACEGLAHSNGGLAWQVHFRQRTDKPNTIRVYRVGEKGTGYSAALKGRAWIDADSFQIVRLETDLVAPLPQIRLAADHAAVEYGPVNFQAGNVAMWLPQTAEFYYDWIGRRGHRIHRYANYLLFSVSDKERISAPKVANTATGGNSGVSSLPNH